LNHRSWLRLTRPRELSDLKPISQRPTVIARQIRTNKHRVDVAARERERKKEDQERVRLAVGLSQRDVIEFYPKAALTVGHGFHAPVRECRSQVIGSGRYG